MQMYKEMMKEYEKPVRLRHKNTGFFLGRNSLNELCLTRKPDMVCVWTCEENLQSDVCYMMQHEKMPTGEFEKVDRHGNVIYSQPK